MTVNPYFNNFGSQGEQNLIASLVIESIKMYGINLYYLPRNLDNLNTTFREQGYTVYEDTYTTAMYIKNVDGFDGEGEFLSSFGVEVREQLKLSSAVLTFHNDVGNNASRIRPLEGDLIFFPLNNALYQIKFVNIRPVFYQFGALQFYDVNCELFEYSNEVFNTGIASIDTKYNAYSTSSTSYELMYEDETRMFTEDKFEIYEEDYDVVFNTTPNNENQLFANSVSTFVDFTEIDPFSEFGIKI